MKIRFRFVAIASLLTCAACSLILDNSAEQCANDSDCAGIGQGFVCRDSVCTKGPGTDDGGEGGSGEGGGDGGTDAPVGFDGCFPGTPTTTEQFLNACTPAQCTPFDNCAKLGVCDGGLLGSVEPDGGGSSSAGSPDSGATELCTVEAANIGLSPVYVTGSSNFPPFLKSFAPVLSQSGYVVVWQTTNSCTGVNVAYNTDPSKRIIKEAAGRQTELYKPDGTVVPCFLAGDTNVDVGESDIYAKTCEQNIGYDPTDPAVATGVGEYLGPTMAMLFITPATSTQTALSAEAAQAVFGRGGVPDKTKLPFDDPTQFFTRASSTATNQIISRGIFVEPTKWWGVDKRTASNMATQMKQVPANLAEKTLGIISADFADKERGNIKTLAFQARGQGCAFWPDSTPFAKDKQNVRDGHYPLWGPLHFFTRLSGGVPTDAAGAFVLRFSVPRLDEALVKSIIESSNIPACAMKVGRTQEMGAISKFDAPYQCDCYFDSLTKGATSCQKCTGAQDCPAARPACNYGYCEVR